MEKVICDKRHTTREQNSDLINLDGKPVLMLCTSCGEYNQPSVKCYCQKRSKRVARLISETLKSGEKCPD